MTTTLQLTAIAALIAATLVRLPSWGRPASRPMTTALALLAAGIILRTEPLNDWGNQLTADFSGWNNLPPLIANLLRCTAYALIAFHILAAIDRRHWRVWVFRAWMGATLCVAATYALSEAPYVTDFPNGYGASLMGFHWLTATLVQLVAHLFMLTCCTIASRDATPRERTVLYAWTIAATAGVTGNLLRVADIAGAWGNDTALATGVADTIWIIGTLSMIGYATGAIINEANKRTRRRATSGVG